MPAQHRCTAAVFCRWRGTLLAGSQSLRARPAHALGRARDARLRRAPRQEPPRPGLGSLGCRLWPLDRPLALEHEVEAEVAPALPPPPAAAAGGATKWNARVRPVPVGAHTPCVAPRLVTLASRRGAACAPRAALGLRLARPAGAARAWRPAHLCICAACAPQRHGAPAADPRRWAMRAPACLGYVQSRVQGGGLSRAAPRRAGGARQRPGRGGRGGLAHAARWPAPGPAAQVPDRAHRGR